MGCSTYFTGELKFEKEMTGSQLATLEVMLGADRRDLGFNDSTVYENGKYGDYWYHIDLMLLDDFSGIKWNESEKTYELQHIVNWVCDQMKARGVNIKLTGEMLAQGEEIDDRWRLVMIDGVAKKVGFPRIGQRITCPCCEKEFTLEENA